MSKTVAGPDGRLRCRWCEAAPEFWAYHDHEWGFPVDDDRRLFEKLCLESFQSGLSWRTILAKRENFRAAFADFDIHRMAAFTDHGVCLHAGHGAAERPRRRVRDPRRSRPGAPAVPAAVTIG
jgi:DNA-3-methyladenine glycosylase I